MRHKLLLSFKENIFFFIPFILWIIIGGILLALFTQDELFFSVNGKWSKLLDFYNTAFSAFGRGDIIPIILISILIIPEYRNRNYVLSITFFGICIPTCIYFAKLFFSSPRPLKVYGINKVHTVPWLDNLFHNSFPSGHTIGAFGFFLLLSLLLPKSQKYWSILFFILALACGYSRMYLGQHFFADVYGGSIIGTILAWLIYEATHHYKPFNSNE